MRNPGLAVLLASLLLTAGPAAAAEAPPDAVTVALASLQSLDGALLPLKAPTYRRADRQKIPDRLADLKRTVDALRLPDAERGTPKAAALEDLRRAVADADARELAFWTSPEAAGEELTAATADALRRDLAAVRAAFAAVTPAAVGVSGVASSVVPREPRAAQDAATLAAQHAAAGTRQSIAAPDAFFDGRAPAGGSVFAEDGHAGHRVPRHAASTPALPFSDLKTGRVPAPEPPRAAPSGYKSRFDQATPVLKTALVAAAATVPVVGPAVLAAAVARPQEDRETALCRDAAGDRPFAAICGLPYPFSMVGPAAAGFVHSLVSLGSIGTLLSSLLIGILIPALTGGVGLVFTILRSLLSFAALVAVGALLYKFATLIHDLFAYPATDPRHWRAAREAGAVAAQLLIAIAATIAGVKIGQSTGASAGIKSGLQAIQARFATSAPAAAAPSGILSEIQGLFETEGAGRPKGNGGNRSTGIEPPEPPPELPVEEPVRNTRHGEERISDNNPTRPGTLDAQTIRATRAQGKPYTASNGAKVYVHEYEPGRFNVVVDGDSGYMTSYRHLRKTDILRQTRRWGWTEAE